MKKSIVAVAGIWWMGCGAPASEPVEQRAQPAPTEHTGYSQDEIIGGVETTGTPGVVAILGRVPDKEGASLCTGTVVSPTVVLTAAHCVHPSTVGEGAVFRVYTAPDITNPDTRGEGLAVRETHFHEGWSSSDLQGGHDLAVVILERPIDITPIPINRAPLTDGLRGQPARIIGYGLNTRLTQKGAGVKRHATVKLNGWNNQFVQTGSWFGKTICSGDSGGPILMKFNDVETVVGVNSFGFIFCLGSANSTRPDTNLEFINRFVP